MAGRASPQNPPTDPIRNFEDNLARVKQLLAIHGVLAPGPGKPAQWRSDIAAAAIVMTIAAVDTYFDDRLRADFERRFDTLDPKQLAKVISRMLVAADGVGASSDSYVLLAKALQSGQPRSLVLEHFTRSVDATTYQDPGIIARDVSLFDVSNLWGRISYCWETKYFEKRSVEKMFREWAERRHGIAHRTGRSRSGGGGLTKARPGQNATRDEANDCLEFFRRLIGLVDYQLNESIYKKQPRTRKSDVAVFDLEPVARRPRRVAVPRRRAAKSTSSASLGQRRTRSGAPIAAPTPLGDVLLVRSQAPPPARSVLDAGSKRRA